MLLYGAVASTVWRLARECRACGHRQIVPASKRDATVPCNICKKPIAAPKR